MRVTILHSWVPIPSSRHRKLQVCDMHTASPPGGQTWESMSVLRDWQTEPAFCWRSDRASPVPSKHKFFSMGRFYKSLLLWVSSKNLNWVSQTSLRMLPTAFTASSFLPVAETWEVCRQPSPVSKALKSPPLLLLLHFSCPHGRTPLRGCGPSLNYQESN